MPIPNFQFGVFVPGRVIPINRLKDAKESKAFRLFPDRKKKKKKSPTPTNNQQSDNLSALRIYYYILPLKKRFLAEDTQRIAIT